MTKVADPTPDVPAGTSASARVVSLYQFVRDQLAANGGRSTQDELLAAIRDNPTALAKLERSQGFGALLSNMKQSGFIDLDGEVVRRTKRRVGRRHR